MYVHRYNLIRHIQNHYHTEKDFIKVTGLLEEEYDALLHSEKLNVSIAYKLLKYAEKKQVEGLFFYHNHFLEETNKITFPIK